MDFRTGAPRMRSSVTFAELISTGKHGMGIEEAIAQGQTNGLFPLETPARAGNGTFLNASQNDPNEIKLDYSDVLLVPGTLTSVSSRKDVTLTASISFENRDANSYSGVPVMAANMDGVGSISMAKALIAHRIFTCLAKTYSADVLIEFFQSDPELLDFCAATIGLRSTDILRFRRIYESIGNLKYVCLDVANGHTQRFVDFVSRFREEFPRIVVIAGNVVTPEQTELLAEAGADLIKVGIGAGSVCETRIKTGVGYPQFSSVLECVAIAREKNVRVVADGGCTCPGDVVKALAAGASFVMLGGMFAGHREGGGKIVTRRYFGDEVDATGSRIVLEKHYVEFYGMSSQLANEKHFDGLKPWKTSEGREVLVPFKPSLDETVYDLLGGLRSACTYVGVDSVSKLPNYSRFVRCHDTHNRVFENL